MTLRTLRDGGAFVGRERELEVLRAHVHEARNGRGSLVLISGEAGIGKSRLADQGASLARRADMKVAWGRCWEGEGAPALWPWVQLVRTLAASYSADRLRRLMGDRLGDLIRFLPSLRATVGESDPTADSTEGDALVFRLFDSVTIFLRQAAGDCPATLILEDMHRADYSSVRLLRYLAAELASVPILLIGTYRDAEAMIRPDLRRTLGELITVGSSERMHLEGFSVDDIAQFVSDNWGASSSEELAQALRAETEGNPLFVNEILRLLIANGELHHEGGTRIAVPEIPETIRDVIRCRLELLSKECRSILAAAATIGRDFELSVLQRVADMPILALLSCIDEGSQARIIARSSSGVGSYRFIHVLIREVLYENLSECERVHLHGVIAQILEDIAFEDSAAFAAALSHHYLEALPQGDADKAVLWTVRAAQHASATFAHREAAGHYQRALAALCLIPCDESRRCQLLLVLGEAQNRAGETAAARESFRTAANRARMLDSAEQFARAALGFGGIISATGTEDIELIALLQESTRRFGDRPSARHAKVLAGLSIALHFHSSSKRCVYLARRAVKMARAVGDQSAELCALEALRYALLKTPWLRQRLELGREMIGIAGRLGEKEMESRGHQRQCADLLELGDIVAVDREIGLLIKLSDQLRQPAYQANAMLCQSMRLLMCGMFDDAESMAIKALQRAEQIDDVRAIASYWVQNLWARRDRGGLEQLELVLRSKCLQFPALQGWRVGLAVMLAEVGRTDEARSLLTTFVDDRVVRVPDDLFLVSCVCLLSITCSMLGDEVRSGTLYRHLEAHAERHAVLGLAAVWLGPVTHYLGLLAATMRQMEAARAHLEAAIRTCDAIGARPMAARTRHELGKILVSCGKNRLGIERIEHAISEFKVLQMGVCVDRATDELRVIKSSVLFMSRRGMNDEGTTTVNVGVSTDGEYIFRPDGDYWTLGYGGKVFRVRQRRGLELIAHLLRNPHQPVHSVDLAALTASRRRKGGAGGVVVEGLEVPGLKRTATDPILDRQARAEYRSRLRELLAEREEAERNNDRGRQESLQAEIEVLTVQLAAAYRPDGRGRVHVSATERARVSVRNSIATVMRMIGEHDDGLRRHLTNSLKTGIVCQYAPETPLPWQL